VSAPERLSMSQVREQRRAVLEADRVDIRGTILAALEGILEEESLHDVSVAQILAAAGVSRVAFYSYFESKFEAAEALLSQVMDTVFEQWRPFVDADEEPDPTDALRDALYASFDLWRRHAAVARMTHQYWSSVPEIGQRWLEIMERFTAGLAGAIDRARAAGVVPDGMNSRWIAAAGLWSAEQLAFVANTGQSADLPDSEMAFEAAAAMWAGLLFGPADGARLR
jgi:AcrR family transcriptional regulator